MEPLETYDGPVGERTIRIEQGRYVIKIDPNFDCTVTIRRKPQTLAQRIKRAFSIIGRLEERAIKRNTIPSRRERIEAQLFKDQINGHRPNRVSLSVNEKQGYLSAIGYDDLRKIYHSRVPLPD